ncbi:MAG: PilZ domain-containing protein [Candidatus Methylomirabilales bacterium]
MPRYTQVRCWPRFVAYLPVQCTAVEPQEPAERRLAGKTLNVGAGGVAVLLVETLPLGTLVLVEFSEGEPLRGQVVWTDRRMRTLLGTAVPHGVAFEQPVEPALVEQWLSLAKKRVHPRAEVRCDVEYAVGGKVASGTCLNLSQGGMFIAVKRPPVPGTEMTLDFTPPSIPNPLSVRGRVMWVSGEEGEPGGMIGMGIQFLELNPLEAAAIGALVDHRRGAASAAGSSHAG